MRPPGVWVNYIHQRQKQIKGSGWLQVAYCEFSVLDHSLLLWAS